MGEASWLTEESRGWGHPDSMCIRFRETGYLLQIHHRHEKAEAVLLGLLRRLMATAPGPLALLPGGGFGGTWGSTSWALPIHYMAFLRAGRGWRWGWGPGIKLAEGPMSSFAMLLEGLGLHHLAAVVTYNQIEVIMGRAVPEDGHVFFNEGHGVKFLRVFAVLL